MTEKKQTLVARLVIHGAAEMSSREVKRLTRWLQGQTETVNGESKNLSRRYTARLWK